MKMTGYAGHFLSYLTAGGNKNKIKNRKYR